jgi:hypothetical protein
MLQRLQTELREKARRRWLDALRDCTNLDVLP